MTTSRELGPGAVIADKYAIVRRIGGGGMGIVFEARHQIIGRRFAIKLLHPALSDSAKMKAWFRREAEAAGRIESENVVAVVDFGVWQERPFIVMELLEGEDLRSLLVKTGRLEPRRAAELIRQACAGVAAGHARSVTHRDLKPENLFVSRRSDGSEWVRVLDFGVAYIDQAEGPPLTTQEGALIGTVTYMAPEQVRGERPVGRQVDVYALGAILYELLSGKPPHSGKRPHAILYAIMHERPTPLGELVPDLPTGLVAAIERALEKDPKDRWQSADDFARALEPFSDRKHAGEPTRFVAPTQLEADSVALQRTEPIAAKTENRRGFWLAALLLAASVVTLIAIRATWLRATPSREVTQAPASAALSMSALSAEPAPIPAQPPLEPARDAASASAESSVKPPDAHAPLRSESTPPAREPPRRSGIPLERENPYQ